MNAKTDKFTLRGSRHPGWLFNGLLTAAVVLFAATAMANHHGASSEAKKKKMGQSMHKMEEQAPAEMDHSMHKMEEQTPAEMDHSMHKMEEQAPVEMDHSMHKMEEQEPQARMNRDEAIASSQDVVAVMNAWVREAVAGAKVNGGYMTLVNGSDQEVILHRIESNSFDSVEIHQMANVDGMMEMQRIENLPIKQGGNAVLKPGGKHLMMMGPKKDLVSGDSVELVLHFASGSVQVINLPVKK